MPLYRLFLCLIALTVCLSANAAQALSIDKIRVGTHPEKTRLVLELSESTDFRTFVLGDPYRLVIDMPSFTWGAGTVGQPITSGITAVRQGNLQPGISRMVFDLNHAITVQSAFVLPKQGEKPNRLVIDFTSATDNVFKAERSKVHGNLDINDTTTNYADKTPDTEQRTASLSTGIPQPPSKPSAVIKPLIIIDPGHGGVDPGALGHNKIQEKKVVLELGKELKRQLESTGRYRVIMTRDSDKFIKLRNRVQFARDHGGDLFISLHADSLDNKNVSGASVYTLSEKASDAQTGKLAARENKADLIAGIDLSVEDEEVANILVDLAMRDTTNQAKFFANTLVNTFKTLGVNILDNTHRHAGFAVLKAPDIPSVLIEAGFMSNRTEAELLNSIGHRKKIAGSVVKGIDAYFEQVKKNQRI